MDPAETIIRTATYRHGRITIRDLTGVTITSLDQPTQLWDASEVDRLLLEWGYVRDGSWTVGTGGVCVAEVRWTGQPA